MRAVGTPQQVRDGDRIVRDLRRRTRLAIDERHLPDLRAAALGAVRDEEHARAVGRPARVALAHLPTEWRERYRLAVLDVEEPQGRAALVDTHAVVVVVVVLVSI